MNISDLRARIAAKGTDGLAAEIRDGYEQRGYGHQPTDAEREAARVNREAFEASRRRNGYYDAR